MSIKSSALMKATPGDFQLIGAVDGSTTTFTDTQVVPGQRYYYQIDAMYQGQDSGAGETAFALVPPTQAPLTPTNLTATATDTGVNLTWDGVDVNSTVIWVQRAVTTQNPQDEQWTTVATISPAFTSYTDDTADGSTSYAYRIFALNPAGKSVRSNLATATTGQINTLADDSGDDGDDLADDLPTGISVDGFYLDMSWASGVMTYDYFELPSDNTSPIVAGIQEVQVDLAAMHLANDVDVSSLNDGKHVVLHVYDNGDWETQGGYLGDIVFDSNDLGSASNNADTAAAMVRTWVIDHKIDNVAHDAAMVLELGLQAEIALLPGPQDLILSELAGKAVAAMATRFGVDAVWDAVKEAYVFKRLGKLVGGKESQMLAVEMANEYSAAEKASYVATSQAEYDSLVAEAKQLYPNQANAVDEAHHIIPMFMGGSKAGATVELPASYHQSITQEFKKLWPYARQGVTNPPNPTRLRQIMYQVYQKYPLPPGTAW